jgi:hypothetical protein
MYDCFQHTADKVADVDEHTAQLLAALGDALGRLFALEKDAHHILEHLQRALRAQVRVDLALAIFVERLVHGSMLVLFDHNLIKSNISVSVYLFKYLKYKTIVLFQKHPFFLRLKKSSQNATFSEILAFWDDFFIRRKNRVPNLIPTFCIL